MSGFYDELDKRVQESRFKRMATCRTDNLHDYQGCANDPSMVCESAPPKTEVRRQARIYCQNKTCGEYNCDSCYPPQPVAAQEICGNEDCDSNHVCFKPKGHKDGCFTHSPSPIATTQGDDLPFYHDSYVAGFLECKERAARVSPARGKAGRVKPPVSFHFIHRWSPWEYVVRKDLQGGEFWCKECLVCGKLKTKEQR